MHPSSSETFIFKNPHLRNTSIRATINHQNQFQFVNNLAVQLPVSVAKKKSISTINIKNLQSFSASSLPYYHNNLSNNCESLTPSSNKNKDKNGEVRQHLHDGFRQPLPIKMKNIQVIVEEKNLFKSKIKNKNSEPLQYPQPNINKNNAFVRESISYNIQNIQNLRQTTCPNTVSFLPKHKQFQLNLKMEAYSKTIKNKNLKLDKVNQNQQQQVKTPKFKNINESLDKTNKSKLFFRQTLDPQLDIRIFQTKYNIISPTNYRKKALDKDISISKAQKIHKNQLKNKTNNTTSQQGIFWKNKAVSPPSKPLPRDKIQIYAQKDIKVPILPFHFDQKPHKPSFFMQKKSLSRFNIMKQLGSGTYSDSFLCIDKKSNAIFCLKRFHKATLKNFPQVLDNFIKKVAFQLLADHPNIVQLYDIFCDTEFVYIVQQYMEGGKLGDLIKKQYEQKQEMRRKTVNFDSAQVKQLQQPLFKQSRIIDKIFDINSALCYIHQSSDKIIKFNKKKLAPLPHGDVRTKSILISMGVCKLPTIQPSQMKPCYIDSYSPPQQIIQQIYIPKSDIWNLGLVLFELCSQRKLFGHAQVQGQNMYQYDCKPGYQVFNVNITQQVQKLLSTTSVLKQLMTKLLAIQPQDRPSSNIVMASNVFHMYGFDVQWKQRRYQILEKQKSQRNLYKYKQNQTNDILKTILEHSRQQHKLNQSLNLEKLKNPTIITKAQHKKQIKNTNKHINLKMSKDSNSNMSNPNDSTQITEQAVQINGSRSFWNNKNHENNKKI